MEKKPEVQPFFAKKVEGEQLVVKTNIRAGGREVYVKAQEEKKKDL